MKKSSLLVSVCVSLISLLPIVPLYSAKPHQGDIVPVTESSPQTPFNIHPENTSPLYVYGGYGYFGWKMISTSDYMNIFTGGDSPGLAYSHNAEPFIVKRYGVKMNVLFLALGMDYLSDKLSLPSEYNNREDVEKTGDSRAQQLKLLSGIRFGDSILHANVILREFSSTITSKGLRQYGNPIPFPLPYYPETGGMIELYPGDETSWYTRFIQYEVKLETMYGFGSTVFGLKVMQYEAPSEIRISTINAGFASGEALMYTDNTLYSLFIGFKSLIRLTGDFYLGIYTPLDLGFGGYRAKSAYFDAGSLNPLSFNSVRASSEGSFTLQYLINHVKVEAGLDYGFHYSMSNLRETKLKKDIEVWRDSDEGPGTIPAGTSVDLSISRMELFWGLYLSACIYL